MNSYDAPHVQEQDVTRSDIYMQEFQEQVRELVRDAARRRLGLDALKEHILQLDLPEDVERFFASYQGECPFVQVGKLLYYADRGLLQAPSIGLIYRPSAPDRQGVGGFSLEEGGSPLHAMDLWSSP